MNNLIIEIPNISDQEMINELAIQVHNLHVKWRNDLFIKSDCCIKKDNRNYWNIFTSGTLSENLFCIDTWTDTCQRTSRSLSEYGRIFRI